MSIKDRVIEESTRMFTTSGLRGVRMDDIATNLGISKRTIYEIFGDKEALIKACVKHFFEQKHMHECRNAFSAGNIIEELIIMLNSSEAHAQKSFVLMNDLKKFYPKIHQSIMEESYDIGTRQLKESIKKGMDEGVFIKQMNIDLTVTIFIGSIQSITNPSGVYDAADNIPIPEAMKYAVIFFFRGISTMLGIKLIDEYLEKKYNN